MHWWALVALERQRQGLSWEGGLWGWELCPCPSHYSQQPLCSIPTPHIPLQTLSPHINIQGTAHLIPSCLSDCCLSFILTLYANPHHLKGTNLLSQLILIDLPGMGKSKERMKGEGAETASPPAMWVQPPH